MLINVNSEVNLTAAVHSIRMMTTAQLLINITSIFTDCEVLLLKAIINSEVTANFISKNYIKIYNIFTERKSLIEDLFLMNNTLRTVSYQIQVLKLFHNKIIKLIIFNIIFIRKHNLILNILWLQYHNLQIDLIERMITIKQNNIRINYQILKA